MSEVLATKGRVKSLSVELDGYTDKFVHIKMYSSDGMTLVDTVVLMHSQLGIYVNEAWEFPNDHDYLIAIVEVFEDELFTVPSIFEAYSFGIDASVSISGSGGGGGDDEIIVLIEDHDIIALVDDNLVPFDNEVVAYVEEEEIFGYVEDDSIELIGMVEDGDEEIIGLVEN